MDATPADNPPPPSPATSTASPVKTSEEAPGRGVAGTGPHSPTHQHPPVSTETMATAAAPTPDAPPPVAPQQQPPASAHAFNAGQQMMHGDASAPPPTVNAAAAASAALMTSSAMTPTTTNYGVNAQLVKASGTLTPMGEDKVSTAGPSGTQKAKQTKKKAAADGETVAKKPSPRVRVKADPNKAEKRKASPARSNSNTAAQSNGATSAPPPTTTTTPAAAPNQPYMAMSENPASGQQQELPPSQDTELRKQYLQRIYRQLQMTHRNQDDTMVRRLATNIEIDICRRVATRADYVNLMNQQIHSLMQAELANGTVGLQSSLYVPGVGMPPSSNAMNVPVSNANGIPSANGMSQSGLQQTNGGAYKQIPVSAAADIGQRASTPTQGSFMSLLSGQSSMQPYDAARAPQQYGAQGLPAQVRQPQYGAGNGTPGYQGQGQGLPQAPSNPQSELPSQQAYAGQRMPTQPSLTSAPPDFVAQFQRLDRNGLVDLLWTQHKTVIQYQRRLAQLEVQLNARQTPGTVGPTNNMAPTSAGIPSGYYNASPRQPSAAVPANVSAEAEEQRARDRATSRAGHQPSQYGQSQYPPSQAPATPQSGVNPPLYWDKVRYLKEAYLRPLYVAHQALSQHSAPANSAQGAKAENVKHNIALACSILSEVPSTVQPRPLEVLESIERFVQSTVVPIVRKVSPHNLGPPTPGSAQQMTPGSAQQMTPGSAQQMRPQQNQADLNDPSRSTLPAVSQSALTPTTSAGMSFANGPQPPTPSAPVAPAKGAAKPKGGAKAGGKKSPSNGPKKAATPKATAPKNATKAAGKKSPGKASGGAKQTAAAKPASKSNNAVSEPTTAPSGPVASVPDAPAPVAENAPKDRSDMAPIKTGGMTDDDLNDFSDFADLDFDDDLQDPLVKISSNKENATGVNARKRSIEDV